MPTVLITGATSGIGRAMAVALGEAGYEVHAIGRNKAALDDLRASRPNIVPLALDVTDRAQIEAAVRRPADRCAHQQRGDHAPARQFRGHGRRGHRQHHRDQPERRHPPDAPRGAADASPGGGAHPVHGIGGRPRALPQYRRLFRHQGGDRGVRRRVARRTSRRTASGSRRSSPGRVETQLYGDILDADAVRAMYAGNLAVQPEDVARMGGRRPRPAAPRGRHSLRHHADTPDQRERDEFRSPNIMKDLSVVIVGGASGLGALLARMAVAEGASAVGIIDLDKDAADAALGPVREKGPQDRGRDLRHPGRTGMPCRLRQHRDRPRPGRHAHQLRRDLPAPPDPRGSPMPLGMRPTASTSRAATT